METVQDMMQADLLESGSEEDTNETLQLLEFYRQHGTTLTKAQIEAIFLLGENDASDLAQYALAMKQHTVRQSSFEKLISKITLADRIKGTAKLSHLMKASANPAQTALKPEDMQAKGMKMKEIDR